MANFCESPNFFTQALYYLGLQWKGKQVPANATFLVLLETLNIYVIFTFLTLLNMAILSLECTVQLNFFNNDL